MYPLFTRGTSSSSDEEAGIVVEIVNELLEPGVSWTDANGRRHPLTLNDILIVSPYNAQVFNLVGAAAQGGANRHGGQVSGAGSTGRGLLDGDIVARRRASWDGDSYSANRFNVATSRARCACILVANHRVFEPECKTPDQMKLANVFCRYLEMAQTIPAMETQLALL